MSVSHLQQRAECDSREIGTGRAARTDAGLSAALNVLAPAVAVSRYVPLMIASSISCRRFKSSSPSGWSTGTSTNHVTYWFIKRCSQSVIKNSCKYSRQSCMQLIRSNNVTCTITMLSTSTFCLLSSNLKLWQIWCVHFEILCLTEFNSPLTFKLLFTSQIISILINDNGHWLNCIRRFLMVFMTIMLRLLRLHSKPKW